MRSKTERFIETFELPPAMVPYAELVVTEQEMDLVIGLGKSKMTIDEIAAMLEIPVDKASELTQAAVNRRVVAIADRTSWRQPIEELEKPLRYETTNFYKRMDTFAGHEFEKWVGVPREARDAAHEWQMKEYLDVVHKENVAEMRADPDARVRVPNRDYLLLEEALEMVDAATDHAVVGCDCRALLDNCDFERDNCVRLDEGARLTLAHGYGRRVTKEEMRQIVIDANMAGLMHTGERFWKERAEVFGFCNCCACCCFPTLAGIKAGLHKTWPRVYYVAERDLDLCSNCGVCAQRCGFAAFFEDESGEVQFNADECRGCGICVTGCPSDAIAMVKL